MELTKKEIVAFRQERKLKEEISKLTKAHLEAIHAWRNAQSNNVSKPEEKALVKYANSLQFKILLKTEELNSQG